MSALHRRGVLRAAGATIAARTPLARTLEWDAMTSPRHNAAPPLPLLGLRLRAARLEAVRAFYRGVIGLEPAGNGACEVSFRAGRTVLTFEGVVAGPDAPDAPRPRAPFYHFAFNIPENRLAEALEWARPRVPIVRRSTGEEVFHFEAWNAHAFYVIDPAGNLVEFIARHTLANASRRAFGPGSIGEVSEIGLVVPDVPSAVARVGERLGASPYLGRTGDEFTAIGDERGLFIVVRAGRPWFPLEGEEAKRAEVFPVTVRTSRSAPGVFAGMPYSVLGGDGGSPDPAS